MDLFTEITDEQANLIGAFEYAPGAFFSPFVGKQVNGNYVVSKQMYDQLKNTEQFQRMDWSNAEWVEREDLNLEITI